MARKTKEILNDEETFKKSTSKVGQKKSAVANKKVSKTKENSSSSKTTKTSAQKALNKQNKNVSKAIKSQNISEASKKTNSKSSSTARKKSEVQNTSKINETLPKKGSKTIKNSKKTITRRKPTVYTPEYYDLPYRYNQTVVKILAQTPSSLFIYWDISDEDRAHLKETYGSHVFEITKPVLIIHNLTMNYSFEVDINDFANSWYLHINDSKCEYNIELGRRPIPINYGYISNNATAQKNEPIKPIEVPYIYISSSNKIESPNDRVLFNKHQNKIYLRNVKTNEVIEKDANSLVFITNVGRFYSISDLYNKFYKDDEIINNDYILNNPSEGNPSSGGPSSKFK